MFRKMIITSTLFAWFGPVMGQNIFGPFFPTLDEELVFAHFGNGQGLVSEILLVNSDDAAEAEAEISLIDDAGRPISVEIDGEVVHGLLSLRIPAAGTRRLRTSGSGSLVVGSVRVRSDRKLHGTILFGGDFGLAGVLHSEPLEFGFLAPVEEDFESQVRTGIAVANLEDKAVDLEVRLYGSEGVQLRSARASLVAKGHLARFVDEFQWEGETDPGGFDGTLEVLSSGRIAATALQVRPRQFASLPVTPVPEDPRLPEPKSICTGRWSGTYDNAHNPTISFRVVDQSMIESVQVRYTDCNGQSAMATASSGTIREDRTFSMTLNGSNIIGAVRGSFARDGDSIDLEPFGGLPSGVFLLQQCGGGSFSWRAQPDQPCG